MHFQIFKRISASTLVILALYYSVSGQSMSNLYPWCIVAYDSEDRTPVERVELLQCLGFTKYAYDWRDRHLDDMPNELFLMKNAGIETVAVWLWLNASRDSVGNLSVANRKVFKILKDTQTKSTIWMSMSPNFFEGLSQVESLRKATDFVHYIAEEAQKVGCALALYNHTGWFGDTSNQIELIEALEEYDIRIVYSFHHAQSDVDEFDQIARKITPYLVAVNLSGVKKHGPKIMTIGDGDHEKEMIETLIEAGFDGPWGILDHVEGEDTKEVLKANIEGLRSLKIKDF